MRVCLFDIDGTILHSGGAGKAAIEAALEEEFDVRIRGRVEYSGRTDRAIGRDLFGLHAIEETPDNWHRLLRGYLARLPAMLRQHRGRILPGISTLLDRLADLDHVALGLLTGNVRAGAQLKLGHFGLAHHFAFGGFGEEHFDRDDVARDALKAAIAHVGRPVPSDEVWVIGDTPLDVRCARCIGARAVAVATGWHARDELEAAQPDLVLDDLSDPRPLMNLLN
jgi:phosphoglycolate phosphatase-like HAD superfamily hydrolase